MEVLGLFARACGSSNDVGAVTVGESRAVDAGGSGRSPMEMSGHLFVDGTGFLLCEGLVGLAERRGCDGDPVEVHNPDLGAAPDIVFLEGTAEPAQVGLAGPSWRRAG